MRRREFLSLLGVAAVTTWPLALMAQSADALRKVGIMWGSPPDDPVLQSRIAMLKQRLSELGWAEGRNVLFEVRHLVGNPERFPAMAEELVVLEMDVILASNGGIAALARQATSTIPIVTATAGELLGTGLIESLHRPGGNVTGVQILSPELMSKRVALLKELLPSLTRLGVLDVISPISLRTSSYQDALTNSARALDIQLHRVETKTPDDIASAFATMAQHGDQATLVISSPLTFANRTVITSAAAGNRLPAMYETSAFATAGGLISYGPDFVQLTREAANFIDKILRGAAPGELPVQQPTVFELVVNLKTAHALGLTIPPSILLRADEVIE